MISISLVYKVHFKSKEEDCVDMEKFTMTETMEKVGLSAPTLRYYEKEQLIPMIARNSSGNRIYTETDIEWISFIKILRATDMPIHLIKEYVAMFKKGVETMQQRKELIESHTHIVEREIEEKLESLKILQRKVKYYETLDRRQQRLSERVFK